MSNSPAKQYILDAYGHEPNSLDDLARCVIAVIEHQMNTDGFSRSRRVKQDPYKVLGFAWNIQYTDMVSNSHSAPVGYPQNWRGEPNLPKGYPGWNGRVWIRYADPCRNFGSTPFSKTLTYTGTGGAGGYGGPWEAVSACRFQRYGYRSEKNRYPEIHCYSWDYRFYEHDWPELSTWVEKQKILSVLSEKPWQRGHTFVWIDEETLAKDREFMAECAILAAKDKAYG